MSSRQGEGSTRRLLQLCLGYFVFYVITGLTVKYFLGSAENGLPGFSGIQYLVFSTIGGTAVALSVVLVLRWYRMDSVRMIQWGPIQFPSEFLYIIPSGVCTAVIIPTTTLMYTLPISVMVAMVIMRGSIIVVSRIIDAIQSAQGILDKKVYLQENLGVVFALIAVATKVLWTPSIINGLADTFGFLERIRIDVVPGRGGFEFFGSPAAMTILSSYIVAYGIRLYIMNYYKNSRTKKATQQNKGFFGVEQLAASSTLLLAAIVLFHSPTLFGWEPAQITMYRDALSNPPSMWGWAILAGTAFGIVAFFSVFLFMFKGRTATFVGLVNRLTSLVAGTVATLIFWFSFGGKFPKTQDWLALFFILVAVAFLSVAEKKRVAELEAKGELGSGAKA